MAATTFYWHDYETFGVDPARDRPVQFAGLRTDAQLNPIGEPLVIYARPADDYLPHPKACLVTGITPQEALAKGLPEREFIRLIHEELAQPGTCGVGYNSLRFDDEVTRYTLYRNFYDPYAREWQNGNSRWDIIDMLRAAYALRPEGIVWPQREDGLVSFKLEELTAANGISHEAAHDALSDVHATIAVARLVREKQPRLYDYVVNHRDKASARQMLDIPAMKPVLHVSGMFGAERFNTALVVPLAQHPSNSNEVICYDLSVDPSPLAELDVETIQQLLYTRAVDLPEGRQRPGLKTIHLNRCPLLVTAKMASPEVAARIGLDGATCRANLAALRAQREADSAAFSQKIQAIYAERQFEPITDPERMLYSGGFFPEQDKRNMARVREASPEQLAQQSFPFEDARLPELLFRYRARNHPETLNELEREQWEEFRFLRLTDPEAGAALCMEEFHELIEQMLAADDLPADDQALLQQLLDYGDSLLA
ncbi:exodeoxyribonuclease I [Parahaliea sp. F7430]|uniref:Exodeoxyribonuclease I n=1 Tax=Sediminihaliea albiluteola TaxID=2758564 RepID=A0A7W2TYJ6_9GAMM|nr:exodeoxyribonuclease I [Sediminihaliea albiluteola]MBA6414301.1 exodeoxyribonuclease I [Sediminihaliea albiluteola]